MILPFTLTGVGTYYDLIKEGISRSMCPISYASPETLNNIMAALMSGEMTCWAIYDKVGEEKKDTVLHGFIYTTTTFDKCTGVRNLLIYSVYSFSTARDFINKKWEELVRKLMEYAKKKGYYRITAYTNIPRVIDITKMVGGQAEFTFLTLDVKE